MKKTVSILLIAALVLSVSASASAMNRYDVFIEDYSGTLTSYVFGVLAGECQCRRDIYSTIDGSVSLSIWTNAKCFDKAAADEQALYLADQTCSRCSWCTSTWSTPQPEYSNASDESTVLCFIDGMNVWNMSSFDLRTTVPVNGSNKAARCTDWLYNGYGDKCLLLCFHETGIESYLESNNSGIIFASEEDGVTYAIWVDNGQAIYWP